MYSTFIYKKSVRAVHTEECSVVRCRALPFTLAFELLALYWAVLRRKRAKKGNNVHRADKFPVPKSDSVYGIRPGARRADHACTLLERSAGALLGAAA